MSLVNDMLKELDSRKAEAPSAERKFSSASAVPKNKVSTDYRYWFFVIGFTLCGAFLAIMLQSEKPETKTLLSDDVFADDVLAGEGPSEETLQTKEVSLAVKPLDTQGEVLAEVNASSLAFESEINSVVPNVASSPISDEADDTVVVSVEKQKLIARLLDLASDAMDMDHLTLPVKGSAYNYYQQILLLDNSQSEAANGISRIKQRYLMLGNKRLRLKQYDRVEKLLVRVEKLELAHPTIAPVGDEITALSLLLTQAKIQHREPEANVAETATVSPDISPSVKPVTEVASDSRASASTAVTTKMPTNVTQSDMALVRQASWQQQDIELAKTANTMVAKGYVKNAEDRLRAFIKQHPSAPASFESLIQLLLKTDRVAEAKLLVNGANSQKVSATARYTALIMLNAGDRDAAIRVLEADPPSIADAPRYHALLAGLYHKSGEYRAAVKGYQTLIRYNPNQSSYWLGLAVAYDAMENNNNALKAFQKARKLSGNSQGVQDYIDKRIAYLSQG